MPDDATTHRVVVADDRVLYRVGQRKQNDQVEGIELGQFALAKEAQQNHEHKVDDYGRSSFSRMGSGIWNMCS